ncbi:MAG: hypothetical protein EA353_00290 [Puniceicoccaceae bacterium]|nr:MAG: hypothetical protein EA353_00290 [Puniceicoccaceae bacterium]
MKKLLLPFFAIAFAATAHSQVVFQDNFSSGTAADAGYYRFGTTGTSLATDDTAGTLNYAYSGTAANRSGVIKQFASTTIEIGETLTFAFTIDARDLRADENNSFRWSIGNIGTSVSADLADAEPFSGGTRQNYVFAAATGVATTALNQHSAGFSSPVNGGTTTNLSGLAASNFSDASTDAFAIAVAFTRTASGLEISKDFGGNISSATFTTTNANDFIFNTLAFSMNNAGDYDFALSDVSVSVIPEPSAWALSSGVLALLMVLRRPRRRGLN